MTAGAVPGPVSGPGDAGVEGRYRVGTHYGIHVYAGDRPVATFHDPAEAALFVAAANGQTPPRRQANLPDARLQVLVLILTVVGLAAAAVVWWLR